MRDEAGHGTSAAADVVVWLEKRHVQIPPAIRDAATTTSSQKKLVGDQGGGHKKKCSSGPSATLFAEWALSLLPTLRERERYARIPREVSVFWTVPLPVPDL